MDDWKTQAVMGVICAPLAWFWFRGFYAMAERKGDITDYDGSEVGRGREG